MRIAICDDDPGYRRIIYEKILRDSISRNYGVQTKEYESGEALLAALDSGYSADVYFLDIQMEQGEDDGIRVGRKLRERGEQGLIVYITGFIDYVQTGYEVRAFRYLLKSQLAEGLTKVLADIRQELAGEAFCFQTGGETVRVERRGILYLESHVRILRLVTVQEEYSFYGSLEQAGRNLGERFLRCHKSYLVNVDKIRKYSAGEIILQGDIGIPVSRSYGKEVKRRLMIEMK